jgi:hypothetical protein
LYHINESIVLFDGGDIMAENTRRELIEERRIELSKTFLAHFFVLRNNDTLQVKEDAPEEIRNALDKYRAAMEERKTLVEKYYERIKSEKLEVLENQSKAFREKGDAESANRIDEMYYKLQRGIPLDGGLGLGNILTISLDEQKNPGPAIKAFLKAESELYPKEDRKLLSDKADRAWIKLMSTLSNYDKGHCCIKPDDLEAIEPEVRYREGERLGILYKAGITVRNSIEAELEIGKADRPKGIKIEGRPNTTQFDSRDKNVQYIVNSSRYPVSDAPDNAIHAPRNVSFAKDMPSDDKKLLS